MNAGRDTGGLIGADDIRALLTELGGRLAARGAEGRLFLVEGGGDGSGVQPRPGHP